MTMTTGMKIAYLRMKLRMTQDDLAEKMNVSRQTIYKWENDTAVPTKDNLKELVHILDTSFDYLLGDEDYETWKDKAAEAQPVAPVVVEQAPVKVPLYTCDRCKKLIYDEADAVKITGRKRVGNGRHHHYSTYQIVRCKECDAICKEEAARAERVQQYEYAQSAKKRKVCSFIFGILVAMIFVIIGVVVACNNPHAPLGGILLAVIGGILGFTFTSCMILFNNIVVDTFLGLASFGVVKMPGIIFEFSIDGLEALIVLKIIFAIIAFLIGVSFALLGIVVGGALSLFVYPFALKKNIDRPEELWSRV